MAQEWGETQQGWPLKRGLIPCHPFRGSPRVVGPSSPLVPEAEGSPWSLSCSEGPQVGGILEATSILMLPPSEKPGWGQKMLEDLGTLSPGVHYARLGSILNSASRHFWASGDGVTTGDKVSGEGIQQGRTS